VPKIKDSFSSGNVDAIEEFEKEYSQNIYAKFCSFIKLNYHKGELALAHLINDKINEEKIFLERRLIVLGSLGNNAPFIGLLGTVFGIIKAFYSLGTLGNAGAEIVMKSISIALVATAGGLLIAIPSVISNNYFNRKLKIMTQTMEQISETALASYHIKGEK
jgi:biopolymer transport protein ExbB